jgi:hypothetical protein
VGFVETGKIKIKKAYFLNAFINGRKSWQNQQAQVGDLQASDLGFCPHNPSKFLILPW